MIARPIVKKIIVKAGPSKARVVAAGFQGPAGPPYAGYATSGPGFLRQDAHGGAVVARELQAADILSAFAGSADSSHWMRGDGTLALLRPVDIPDISATYSPRTGSGDLVTLGNVTAGQIPASLLTAGDLQFPNLLFSKGTAANASHTIGIDQTASGDNYLYITPSDGSSFPGLIMTGNAYTGPTYAASQSYLYGNLTLQNGVLALASKFSTVQNSKAANDGYLRVAGGSDASTATGAWLEAFGNSYGNGLSGNVYLALGNVAGATGHLWDKASADRLTWNESGVSVYGYLALSGAGTLGTASSGLYADAAGGNVILQCGAAKWLELCVGNTGHLAVGVSNNTNGVNRWSLGSYATGAYAGTSAGIASDATSLRYNVVPGGLHMVNVSHVNQMQFGLGGIYSFTSAAGTVVGSNISLLSTAAGSLNANVLAGGSFSVTVGAGAPVLTVGAAITCTVVPTLPSQSANTIFAGGSAGAGVPSFRALVAADIPTTLNATAFTGNVSVGTNGVTLSTACALNLGASGTVAATANQVVGTSTGNKYNTVTGTVHDFAIAGTTAINVVKNGIQWTANQVSVPSTTQPVMVWTNNNLLISPGSGLLSFYTGGTTTHVMDVASTALQMYKHIEFAGNDVPGSTVTGIGADASAGNLTANVPTGKSYIIGLAGNPIATFGTNGMVLANFTTNILSTSIQIFSQLNNTMSFNVPSTGAYNYYIGGTGFLVGQFTTSGLDLSTNGKAVIFGSAGAITGTSRMMSGDPTGTSINAPSGLTVNLCTNGTARLSCGLSVVVGTAALATTATDGFLYIASCPGTPTGVPTANTGRVPIVYDSSANKLWIYNGSWRSATFT